MAQFLYHSGLDTPLGWFHMEATEQGLSRAWWTDTPVPNPCLHPVLQQATEEVNAYFAGHVTAFQTPLAPEGTEFQRMVWEALNEIPIGKTWSYAECAHHLGIPRSIRAMAAANGKNPLALFIPCHRVVGSGGKLVGYAGGLDRKRWLLDWEQRDFRLFP